jgi:F0F1-type ATP synthase assembly protein I
MESTEILPWLQEVGSLYFFIPLVLVFMYLRRRSHGHAGFTERDWRFLFGHSHESVFTLRLWTRFFALLLTVVVIGLALGYLLAPIGVWWFLGALLIAGLAVLIMAPRWLG